jgi:hypothetical protein
MMMEGLQTTFSIAFRDVVDAFMTAAFDDIKDLMLIQGPDADRARHREPDLSQVLGPQLHANRSPGAEAAVHRLHWAEESKLVVAKAI